MGWFRWICACLTMIWLSRLWFRPQWKYHKNHLSYMDLVSPSSGWMLAWYFKVNCMTNTQLIDFGFNGNTMPERSLLTLPWLQSKLSKLLIYHFFKAILKNLFHSQKEDSIMTAVTLNIQNCLFQMFCRTVHTCLRLSK